MGSFGRGRNHEWKMRLEERRAAWSDAFPYLSVAMALQKVIPDECHPAIYAHRNRIASEFSRAATNPTDPHNTSMLALIRLVARV